MVPPVAMTFKSAQQRQIHAPAVTLVRQRRIRETVRNHQLALFKGGPDHLADVLCPVRQDQEQFGLVREGFRAAFEQEFSEILPQRGITRLTSQQPGHPARIQVLVKQPDLPGFSRSVAPLDGHETQHPTA